MLYYTVDFRGFLQIHFSRLIVQLFCFLNQLLFLCVNSFVLLHFFLFLFNIILCANHDFSKTSLWSQAQGIPRITFFLKRSKLLKFYWLPTLLFFSFYSLQRIQYVKFTFLTFLNWVELLVKFRRMILWSILRKLQP